MRVNSTSTDVETRTASRSRNRVTMLDANGLRPVTLHAQAAASYYSNNSVNITNHACFVIKAINSNLRLLSFDSAVISNFKTIGAIVFGSPSIAFYGFVRLIVGCADYSCYSWVCYSLSAITRKNDKIPVIRSYWALMGVSFFWNRNVQLVKIRRGYKVSNGNPVILAPFGIHQLIDYYAFNHN